MWDFSSEQIEMGTLQLLTHYVWWSSCLDDSLSLTTHRKENLGCILQWERIQGIWSWASHSDSLLCVPGGYFTLCCWCCATVQWGKLCKAGQRPASCLTETFGEKTEPQKNPDSRDQKPHLFKPNVFSNCQKQFTLLKQELNSKICLRSCGQCCAESQHNADGPASLQNLERIAFLVQHTLPIYHY